MENQSQSCENIQIFIIYLYSYHLKAHKRYLCKLAKFLKRCDNGLQHKSEPQKIRGGVRGVATEKGKRWKECWIWCIYFFIKGKIIFSSPQWRCKRKSWGSKKNFLPKRSSWEVRKKNIGHSSLLVQVG